MALPPRTLKISPTLQELAEWEWLGAKRGMSRHAYVMRAVREQAARDRKEFGDPPAIAVVDHEGD